MRKASIYFSLATIVLITNSAMAGGNPPKDTTQKEEKIPLTERIEKFAMQDKFLSKLVRSVWVFKQEEIPSDTTVTSHSIYTSYEGYTISKIEVQSLDPFGYSVYEKSCKPINLLQRVGNGIHYSSRPWVIENKLLFKEGDSVDAFTISESERLLRANENIHDAKIILVPEDSVQKTVKVIIITQDIWGLTGSLSADPVHKKGSVAIKDINFLGLEHRLNSRVWYKEETRAHWQFNGSYYVPEIAKTFISAETYYLTEDLDTRYGFRLNRPFLTNDLKWAGGINIESRKDFFDIIDDTLHLYGNQKINMQDIWLGYAFTPWEGSNFQSRKTQLMFSARVLNLYYPGMLFFPKAMDKYFMSETLFLMSTGIGFREYFKDKYIFGFGKTEDIPIGYMAVITSGISYRNKLQRPYLGLKLAKAWNNTDIGYTSIGFQVGGYPLGNRLESGSVSTQVLYFTNLVPAGDWFIRQYVWNRLVLGYNREPGQYLNINQGNGLRGFDAPMIGGGHRWVTNYEINFFSPFKPLGFNTAGILFADYALLGDQNRSLFKSILYQGYGIGLRLKNEHLLFPTFQISFHYFPIMIAGVNNFNFLQSRHTYYRFDHFQFDRPDVAPY